MSVLVETFSVLMQLCGVVVGSDARVAEGWVKPARCCYVGDDILAPRCGHRERSPRHSAGGTRGRTTSLSAASARSRAC